MLARSAGVTAGKWLGRLSFGRVDGVSLETFALKRTMQDEEKKTDLREVLAVVKRRTRPMLVVAAGGLVITLLLALFLPAYYRSAGTILIEQQELPAELVRSTVTSYADQRVQVISQRVTDRKNLLGIIDRYDLYPRSRHRDTRERASSRRCARTSSWT